jgi:hypothetical protein
MKNGCIGHAVNQRLVIVREDYLALCENDHCAAVILNVFEYWHNVKLAQAEQTAIESGIAATVGITIPVAELWVWKSIPDLEAELLGLFGERKISIALNWLKQSGYLESRNNPLYPYDRTLQYLFNATAIQDKINTLASEAPKPQKRSTQAAKKTASKSQKSSLKAAKIPLESRKKAVSLIETTTETTPKDKSVAGDSRPLFRAIALHLFGIAGKISDESLAPRIGLVEKHLKRLNPHSDDAAIADRIPLFVKWYQSFKEGAELPRDWSKVVEHFLAFEAWEKTQTVAPTAAPILPVSDELIEAERQQIANTISDLAHKFGGKS